MLKQLKSSELPALREKWWKENHEYCPITAQKIPLEDAVCDHQHKCKSEEADESGKGLCRGVLSRKANAWEGKVTNAFRRVGLHKDVDIITALENLANYLRHNYSHEEVKYIHPSEAPKKRKIKKSSYNKLKSRMKFLGVSMKALPKYTGNSSKAILKLFEKYDVVPEYYGD